MGVAFIPNGDTVSAKVPKPLWIGVNGRSGIVTDEDGSARGGSMLGPHSTEAEGWFAVTGVCNAASGSIVGPGSTGDGTGDDASFSVFTVVALSGDTSSIFTAESAASGCGSSTERGTSAGTEAKPVCALGTLTTSSKSCLGLITCASMSLKGAQMVIAKLTII